MKLIYCQVFCTAIIMCMSIGAVSASEEPFMYDAHDKRDPLIPLLNPDGSLATDVYKVQSLDEIQLEGIVWERSGRSLAIINGILVQEGEHLGIFTIQSIEEKMVTIIMKGKEFQLFLREDES